MQLTAHHSIGPYQLPARIGDANMGEVWRASRASDPHRIVASYLVMPYLRGGSLEDLPNPSRGVLHRDVKPSNILLDGDRAFLSDFGVACRLGVPGPLRGESSGTITYMSPEQIQNPQTADQRSDVYRFGCVLSEMLSGRPPIPLRQLNAAIDPRLAELVMTALALREARGESR